MLDLNIILDVVQHRLPHYQHSAEVVSAAIRGDLLAFIPAHTLTTLFYVVTRVQGRDVALKAVDWILDRFEVVFEDATRFRRARQLMGQDFEDAVVMACAESAGCSFIITRDIDDFKSSPVQAVLPETMIANLLLSQDD